MIKLAGIGHVLLRVADEEASKRFYRDVLGFRVAEQDPEHGGVFMTLGELARGFVVDREPQGRLRGLDALPRPLRLGQRRHCRLLRAQPSRSHEDDGVLDIMALEAMERLEILGKDA